MVDKAYRVAASAFGAIVGASAAYADGIPPEAVWHFDETGGIVAVDATGHGHNGTLKNVVIGRPGHTGLPGGDAYYFNGINAKVTVPNVSSLQPGGRNVSISVWYNNLGCPQSDPADCDLWKYGASPDPRTKMEVLHSGMVDCGFAGSKSHIDIVGGPAGGVADGKWHKVECDKTATQVILLVDDVVVKSSNVVIGDINPKRDATIGASGGSDWTTGMVDEVAVVYSPAQ
jgi:Concanavalin A-like lectin/glucanases superfamily